MIHSTAIVSDKAKIGSNVSIGAYAIIDDDVKIGDNCVIGPRVHLESCVLGNNNFIGEGSLIGGPPQDLKYNNEKSTVRIGDNNVIREYVTIHRATHEGEATVIGDSNFIMTMAHIGHDCRIGNKVIMVNSIGMSGHCEVDNGAFISGHTLIHQFCRIGRNVMVGGGTKITKDVPPFVMISGDTAAVHGLNKVGLKRAGFGPDRLRVLEQLYSIFFREKLLFAEAVKKIKDTLPQNEDVTAFLDFVTASKRGIER